MFHKFIGVEETKRDSLINAGFMHFGTHGKNHTSLNTILKTAGMSKGVFYHYFKDKDDFYEFLLVFSGRYITKELEEESLISISDFMERLIQSFLVKYDLFRRYNNFTQFLVLAYQENDIEYVTGVIQRESNNYEKRFISENLDFSKYKSNDNTANIRVVGRYLNSVFNEIVPILKDVDKDFVKNHLYKEAEYLKTIIYKEEYLWLK